MRSAKETGCFPYRSKPSVLQKLNDMKGVESSTGVKKPHVKEER